MNTLAQITCCSHSACRERDGERAPAVLGGSRSKIPPRSAPFSTNSKTWK
jgi:hypothetical protein